MSNEVPELTVRVLPDGVMRTFAAGSTVVIGREDDCDVVVADDTASRRHVIVNDEPGVGWVLVDASRNGTFLNGGKVGRHVLDREVTIRIGNAQAGTAIRLGLALGSPAAAPVATAVGVAASAPGVAAPGAAAPGAPLAAGPVPAMPGKLGPMRDVRDVRGLGAFSRAYEAAKLTRIGRADDNDIVLTDLLVSRHHAQVRRRDDGRCQVVDLGSHNGTYLNGRRLNGKAEAPEGSTITIGHHAFVVSDGNLREFIDNSAASFAAIDLSVRVGSKALLRDVSFSADGGEFVTVLGPTGAGKSTLIKALSGYRPADVGHVLYNGRDIYANHQELRQRIGYVPQDDVLHPQLTVRRALQYSARLRFPPDVPTAQRHERVEQVIGELGLDGCADVRLSNVSGGQRKRTSIALELLTKPSLLILDEPTSGLDPWYEWTVMELLRGLADGGRTVVAVTHTVESLDLCDRILFLAPGGQTAFFGPPAESLPYFGATKHKEIFNQLNHAPQGQLANRFMASPEEVKYVQGPLAPARAQAAARAAARSAGQGDEQATPATSAANPGWLSQLSTLTNRFTSVVAADRRNTMMLFLQAPILGILMALVLPKYVLEQGDRPHGASPIITALVLGATYLGASNSIREIVKERAILTRERAVGLAPVSYVLSKVLLLGVLTIAQAAVLTYVGVSRQGFSASGSVLPSGEFELFLVAATTGLAAMSLGLLISALVSNADKALTILPVVLFAQFLLTGGLVSTDSFPIKQLSYLSSAHWGYAAAASTVNYDTLTFDGCNGALQGGPHVACNGAWAHTGGAWAGDMAALAVIAAVCLVAAVAAVSRVGQPRRR